MPFYSSLVRICCVIQPSLVVNAVFACESAVIGYFVAVSNKREPSYRGISQLFLGAYPTSALRAWKGTSVVLLFLFLVAGWVGLVFWNSRPYPPA